MTNQKPRGFSLRTFMLTPDADGPRIIEKSNWSGKGLMCPRAAFPDYKSRPEFQRTGVYILIGEDSNSELPIVYIGEGDPIIDRFNRHITSQDMSFWHTLYAFTSKDDNLNKAHVQFLESRLVQLARSAKNCLLRNINTPQAPSLSEADAAETETFLEEMLLCMKALGLRFFDDNITSKRKDQILFTLASRSLKAQGYWVNTGFTILEGSEASLKDAPSAAEIITRWRKDLRQLGVLKVKGKVLVFAQNYTLTSPSLAAGIVYGRNANGLDSWKDSTGNSLNDYKNASHRKDKAIALRKKLKKFK
ncbi:MAG TPA: GIY-YIG nuclease family protein [Bacteroidia bacterium]|nr:GIY-YIG nuclease family protein [Bacteroidia bacterium]